jgi:hypothetical protein
MGITRLNHLALLPDEQVFAPTIEKTLKWFLDGHFLLCLVIWRSRAVRPAGNALRLNSTVLLEVCLDWCSVGPSSGEKGVRSAARAQNIRASGVGQSAV